MPQYSTLEEIPHSAACDRNALPILNELKSTINFSSTNPKFLEVGFGTGQHACLFAKELPQLEYYACDQEEYHPILKARKELLGMTSLKGPYLFKSEDNGVLENLPDTPFSIIFSANTLHIMSWKEALSFLTWVTTKLEKDGLFISYGPFKFEGNFIGEGNKNFDQNLKMKNPLMGIRNFEEIKDHLGAGNSPLIHQKTVALPANNHILVFKKS